MPVNFTTFPDLNIALCVFSGLARAEENIEAVLEYRSRPDYDSMLHILMDLADCRFPETFFTDMKMLQSRLGFHFKSRDPRSHTSIYAPGDVAYGTARMFKSSVNPNSPNPVKYFRNAEDALRFVDLDPSDHRVQGLLRPPPLRARRTGML
ncbi:hypothetical protein [Sagittula salina]|uniref:Uncharacterized protein n=1 Tax=Sagittula salina TaxID=2820268 RepID=A0A940S0U1_9RHOB|nr:hypothetical protein [Sagittula salina]MBP0482372.1 hypothetical protein [Sagittula salina]